MRLSRRAVLTALLPALGPRAAGAAPFATLRPRILSELGFTPLPQERLAFHVAGLGPPVTLPAARAHLAALLPIAGRQVAVLGFGADPPDGMARRDLAAVVGWDGSALRVLALELLAWQAPDGGRLATRFNATGDRTRLLLLRDAAAPRGPTRWRHASWTDLLAWREAGPLADAAIRPSLPGTWQARLAAVQARVAARLLAPRRDIGEDLIALFAPADLPPG